MNYHRRGGHYPGHLRNTALAAFEAWLMWQRGDPEPAVEHEVNYEPQMISLSDACRLVWNCTDILPGRLVGELKEADLPLKSHTYAAAARAVLADIKSAA
jgi:hypothetical protein